MIYASLQFAVVQKRIAALGAQVYGLVGEVADAHAVGVVMGFLYFVDGGAFVDVVEVGVAGISRINFHMTKDSSYQI